MFVIDRANSANILPLVQANIDRETYLMTDEAAVYPRHMLHRYFLGHGRVNHKAGEYVRGRIHTKTVEGSFSIFKRGMKGVYQHCSEKHLRRYLAELEFCYNNREALGCNDGDRSTAALRGLTGKRLTYGGPHA